MRTALLICLIGGLAGHHVFLAKGNFATDDALLFYMSGLNIVHGEKLEELNQRAIDYYTAQRTGEHESFRLKFRKDYLNEYTFPGAVFFGVSRIFKPLFDSISKLYPLFLTEVVAFSFALCFILLFSLLLIIIRSTGQPLFCWALAATLILFGFSELLPVQGHNFPIIILPDNLRDALQRLGELLLRPGHEFSPLSFAPRNNFALLMIGVFALRWTDRHLHAYVLLFFLSLVHLGTSGLLWALLVFVDLLLRPHLFRRPAVLGVVALTGAVFFARETMWEVVGERALTVAAAGAALFVLLGLLLAVPQLRQPVARLGERYRSVRGALLRRGDVAADIIVITIFWLVTVSITYLVTYLFIVYVKPFPQFQFLYFWGQLHGRLLLAIWPSVVFALALLSLRWAAARHDAQGRNFTVWIASVALLPALALAWHSVSIPWAAEALPLAAEKFGRAEIRLHKGPMTRIRPLSFDELVLYYAISKSVDTDEDALRLIVP